MPSEFEEPTFTNDAFISYSRKDREFARRLEKALEGYKPRKNLKVPQRNLVVFRDEADFTGVEYEESIEKHLKNSKKMIVICSPDARKSKYVNDEIRRFAEARAASNIIPVLISGIPNNEAKPGQEDDLSFPEALCEVQKMPVDIEYRGFDLKKDRVNKSSFENRWYILLANLYDFSRPDEVQQREKKRQIRTRNAWIVGLGSVSIILAGALVFALISRNQAQDRLVKNYWSRAVSAMRSEDWLRASHFFARCGNESGKPLEIKSTILSIQDCVRNSFLISQMAHQGEIARAVFSRDDQKILTWGSDGPPRLWHAGDGSPAGQPMKHDRGRVYGATFSKDGQLFLTWGEDGTARLWYAKDGSPAGQPMRHEGSVSGAAFSKDGQLILTWGEDGTARLWDMAADYDFPNAYLPLLVEVVTGTAMDELGNVTALNSEKWGAKKKEYINIAEKHLKTCQYKNANIYLKQKKFWESPK